MDKRKIAIALVVVFASAAAAWAFGLFGGKDPVVAEMQQLRDQMFQNRDLPETERRAQWENYRQRMEGLTDAQRAALRRTGATSGSRWPSSGWTSFSSCRPTSNGSGSMK